MLSSELERFAREDLGEWDDSSAIVPEISAEAVILAKEECIVSGLKEAVQILKYFGLEGEGIVPEGACADAGSIVMTIRGRARAILQAERLVLNFMSRMSGISTLTRDCVGRAGNVRVACTRKTTPGFRSFEKRAVVVGGGDPHRFDLSSSVIIKDNHLKLMSLEEALRAARLRASFTKKIEVEVERLEDALKAASLGADIIMFDNMQPETIREGVELLKREGLRDRVLLEASGGITPENISDYAAAGVDVVSMGALTRSAKWIDFSLEIER
ncbi:MAG TPA: carboxylating nicotinate-nucleotide diphosphorylase [Methanothrix sp.]|nr:carboxylating nicotinate-nucleotide diphosphorylase [Methanothrix sp.]HPJ85006.1 carboxylating nicotinate-nucleotide diphosphorylase [Methanothrix sp.]HPR65612.1 carboxylating nicotinate-nucleotide diphosphorylase [Methanothrix sp.]